MANKILLEFILGSVILFTGSTVNSQDFIATKCLSDDTKCYTLYAADLTWQVAYNSCLSRNQHLATIQNAQTQSIMEMFASDDVYPVGAAHAWVAGKRSEDMTWRHLDGQVFNYDGFILNEGDESGLCMLQNGFPGYASDHALHLAVRCYDQTPYKAVCEYDRLPGAGCPDDNITIHQPSVDKCNTVSSRRYQSWHDARQYCQGQGWQLAHTGAGSWDFYKQLTITDKPLIRDESAFWIDVHRRLWEWKIRSVVLLTGSTVDSQETILTKCLSDDTKCYTLYRADLTWQEAYNECSSRNQHLATIQDAQTQDIMVEFAAHQAYTEPAQAWVAGRRRQDTTWRDLNGEIFNYDGYIFNEENENNLCMLLNGRSGYVSHDPLHKAVSCYVSAGYKALCEYDPPGAGCPDDDITIYQPSVNKCNTVSRAKYKSWYEARQYCQTGRHDWELAHIGAGSWDFYLKLTDTNNPIIHDSSDTWIGVQRRPWVWIINETVKVYSGTTYWHSREGLFSEGGCMHIELNDSGFWSDKRCEARSSYFVCEYDQLFTTSLTTSRFTENPTVSAAPSERPGIPIMPPATSRITTREDKDTGITARPPGETTSGSTENPTVSAAASEGIPSTTVYIIIGVAGGVLVVVIIIVVFVCASRRRKENPSPNTTAAMAVKTTQLTDRRDGPQQIQPDAVVTLFTNNHSLPVKRSSLKHPDDLEIIDNATYGAAEFTGLDKVSSGDAGPSQIVTNDGDVYSMPVKKSSLKQDDDLEIIDNPTYGAA